MFELFDKITNIGVLGVYTQGFHPMEVVLLSFEDLRATSFA